MEEMEVQNNPKGNDFQGELQALNLPVSHIKTISHIY
jgi:hypothetical protein